jgi:SOS-response transcriptional repressor LexA
MHVEDLQILVIGHVDRQEVDALLWDPMPGGSGLLQQLCGRFGEVAAAAQRIVAECPAACAVSCVDCLQSFRNSYYHKYLDRGTAARCLGVWGTALRLSHDIPAFQPAAPEEVGTYPVNEPERRLRAMLLGAGFPEGVRGEQVRLDPAIGTTTPDVIFRGDIHDEDEGIAVYLDGLSEHIHGSAATEQKDREIRDWLRNNGWDVIEIAVSELADAGVMARYFRRLAGYLNRADIKERVRKERAWFEGAAEPVAAAGAGGAAGRDRDEAGDRRAGPVSGVAGGRRPQLRLVTPTAEERYVRAVPLVPLRAAAGAFGEPQHTQDENWDWVEVDTGRSLLPGMFVAQVVGHSMEPRIPDGSYCLFSSPVTGTRNGKIVLVELQDTQDPETGERYTVKRYCSEKSQAGEGTWRHVRVTLEPLNPEFEPIDLKMEDEGRLRVVAEFVQVVGG